MKKERKFDLHPKSWTQQTNNWGADFFMGKHYTIEFKLQVLQPILNEKMSIREAARFYNIPSNALVGTWLKRFFEKHNELDHEIKNMQENIQLATHMEIEALKKEKLRIKDELYEYLKKKSQE